MIFDENTTSVFTTKFVIILLKWIEKWRTLRTEMSVRSELNKENKTIFKLETYQVKVHSFFFPGTGNQIHNLAASVV
jgi:hypothetical protein